MIFSTSILAAGSAGAIGACGIVLVAASWRRRRPRLDDRLRGLRSHSQTQRGFTHTITSTLTRLVDAMGSTSASVERRLELCGRHDTLTHFRLFQMAVALAFTAASGALAAWGAWSSHAWWLAGPIVFIGALIGAAAADQLLTYLAHARQRAIDRQVPDASELMALAVSAGESVPGALARLSMTGRGELAQEFRITTTEIKLGVSTSRAVAALEQRNDSASLSRLCDTLVTSLERGSPLAGVLRDQARDIRERERQALMEQGGRKEIAMLVPVVFLILPITIVFAFYPGLAALSIPV